MMIELTCKRALKLCIEILDMLEKKDIMILFVSECWTYQMFLDRK